MLRPRTKENINLRLCAHAVPLFTKKSAHVTLSPKEHLCFPDLFSHNQFESQTILKLSITVTACQQMNVYSNLCLQ